MQTQRDEYILTQRQTKFFLFHIGESSCFSGCNNNSFGEDCKLMCNCAEETEVCDNITGICPKSGCKTGFSEESGCQGKYLIDIQNYHCYFILGAIIYYQITCLLCILLLKTTNNRQSDVPVVVSELNQLVCPSFCCKN